MVSVVWFRNTTYLRIGDMPEKHDVDLLGPAGAEGRLNPTEPDPSSIAGTEAGTAEGGLVPSLNPTSPSGCYTRNNLTITFLMIAFTLKHYNS